MRISQKLTIYSAGCLTAWGLWEAQAVETRSRALLAPALPAPLDGLRIAHLSDFHLGAASLNGRAVRRAVDGVCAMGVDVVCITGDLRTRVRGQESLEAAVARLADAAPLGVYTVRGNHDIGDSRDPFCDRLPVDRDLCRATNVEGRVVTLDREGARIAIAGLAPTRTGQIAETQHRALDGADLAIVLSHYPEPVADVGFDAAHTLLLAGHLHGGQLCVPWPSGRIRLSHGTAPQLDGVVASTRVTRHVSRGVGTTFVPFRFLARPEATVFVVTGAAGNGPQPRQRLSDDANHGERTI